MINKKPKVLYTSLTDCLTFCWEYPIDKYDLSISLECFDKPMKINSASDVVKACEIFYSPKEIKKRAFSDARYYQKELESKEKRINHLNTRVKNLHNELLKMRRTSEERLINSLQDAQKYIDKMLRENEKNKK